MSKNNILNVINDMNAKELLKYIEGLTNTVEDLSSNLEIFSEEIEIGRKECDVHIANYNELTQGYKNLEELFCLVLGAVKGTCIEDRVHDHVLEHVDLPDGEGGISRDTYKFFDDMLDQSYSIEEIEAEDIDNSDNEHDVMVTPLTDFLERFKPIIEHYYLIHGVSKETANDFIDNVLGSESEVHVNVLKYAFANKLQKIGEDQ